MILVDQSITITRISGSNITPHNQQKILENWKRLTNKAIEVRVIPNTIKLSLFKLKRVMNLVKRAVNTISMLYLQKREKRKQDFNKRLIGNWISESEMQSGLRNTISDSDLSSDFSRDDEQEEDVQKLNSVLKDNLVSEKIKQSKFMPHKLDMIPEASIRFEETLLVKNSNPNLDKTVSSTIKLKKNNNSRLRFLNSDDLIFEAIKHS